MKTLTTLAALTFCLIFGAGQTAFAQYSSDPYERVQQIVNQLQARQINTKLNVINAYRQKTGDYRNSNQAVWNYIVAKSKRENPQAWAKFDQGQRVKWQQFYQHQAAHRAKVNAFDQQQAAHRANVAAWNANFRRNYRINSAAMDRAQQQRVNAIWDRSNFVNPNTGVKTTLPHYSPGFHRGSNGQVYFQNQNGQYYQYHNGYYYPMNQVR